MKIHHMRKLHKIRIKAREENSLDPQIWTHKEIFIQYSKREITNGRESLL